MILENRAVGALVQVSCILRQIGDWFTNIFRTCNYFPFFPHFEIVASSLLQNNQLKKNKNYITDLWLRLAKINPSVSL